MYWDTDCNMFCLDTAIVLPPCVSEPSIGKAESRQKVPYLAEISTPEDNWMLFGAYVRSGFLQVESEANFWDENGQYKIKINLTNYASTAGDFSLLVVELPSIVVNRPQQFALLCGLMVHFCHRSPPVAVSVSCLWLSSFHRKECSRASVVWSVEVRRFGLPFSHEFLLVTQGGKSP